MNLFLNISDLQRVGTIDNTIKRTFSFRELLQAILREQDSCNCNTEQNSTFAPKPWISHSPIRRLSALGKGILLQKKNSCNFSEFKANEDSGNMEVVVCPLRGFQRTGERKKASGTFLSGANRWIRQLPKIPQLLFSGPYYLESLSSWRKRPWDSQSLFTTHAIHIGKLNVI